MCAEQFHKTNMNILDLSNILDLVPGDKDQEDWGPPNLKQGGCSLGRFSNREECLLVPQDIE